MSEPQGHAPDSSDDRTHPAHETEQPEPGWDPVPEQADAGSAGADPDPGPTDADRSGRAPESTQNEAVTMVEPDRARTEQPETRSEQSEPRTEQTYPQTEQTTSSQADEGRHRARTGPTAVNGATLPPTDDSDGSPTPDDSSDGTPKDDSDPPSPKDGDTDAPTPENDDADPTQEDHDTDARLPESSIPLPRNGDDGIAPTPGEDAGEQRSRRRPGVGTLAAQGLGGLVRLVLVLACFGLAYYTVDLLLLGDPSVYLVAIWFAGALFLHDLVLFPLYASGDRILTLVLRALPRTRVPLVNHIRIPVLGAGLTLLMFLPGIIRQGEDTHLAASGLTQEPYRERWVWLAVGLFAASAVIWLLRTLIGMLLRALRSPGRDESPGHDEQVVDGEREDGLGDEPPADLAARKQGGGEDEPDAER